MSTTLTLEQAFELAKSHSSKKNIVYHMIAVEAVMRESTSHRGRRGEAGTDGLAS
jgi:predicted hydrolase (HD superfamily)